MARKSAAENRVSRPPSTSPRIAKTKRKPSAAQPAQAPQKSTVGRGTKAASRTMAASAKSASAKAVPAKTAVTKSVSRKTKTRSSAPAAARSAAAKRTSARASEPVGSSGADSAAVDVVLRQLEALGTEAMRAFNAKRGADANQFGCKMGDLRPIAATLKKNHSLALELWQTGNLEARLVATLVLDAKRLSTDELERLVTAATFPQLADWLHSYVTKEHPAKETLRLKWMTACDPMAARAGWRLTAGRAKMNPDGLDLPGLLDRIEAEMGSADPAVQWTMNMCLAEIGIHHPNLRSRAIAIGEKLGLYRDYPVSKGCTSPFAPIWINALVNRQK